jgi:hypothetical protein
MKLINATMYKTGEPVTLGKARSLFLRAPQRFHGAMSNKRN